MSKYLSGEKIKYLFYTISHPMDGYYWIRHQDRGSVPLALLLVILFSFSFTMNRLLASFVVNDIDSRYVDLLTELSGVFLLFLLLCVSNWSVTCLMKGEGRLKDIVIAIGYATVPISAALLFATLVSQVVAENEEAFYTIILVVGIGYGLIMLIIGIMQVHYYTLGVTLGTLLLTFVALLIIIFLLLLFASLLGSVMLFFESVYTEIIFRL